MSAPAPVVFGVCLMVVGLGGGFADEPHRVLWGIASLIGLSIAAYGSYAERERNYKPDLGLFPGQVHDISDFYKKRR